MELVLEAEVFCAPQNFCFSLFNWTLHYHQNNMEQNNVTLDSGKLSIFCALTLLQSCTTLYQVLFLQ